MIRLDRALITAFITLMTLKLMINDGLSLAEVERELSQIMLLREGEFVQRASEMVQDDLLIFSKGNVKPTDMGIHALESMLSLEGVLHRYLHAARSKRTARKR